MKDSAGVENQIDMKKPIVRSRRGV